MSQLKSFIIIAFLALTSTCFFTSCEDGEERGGSGTGTAAITGNGNRNDISIDTRYGRLEFPHLKGGKNNRVIIHDAGDGFGVNYSLEWDCEKKSQRWSCYQIYSTTRKNLTQKRWEPDANSNLPQYPFDPDLPGEYYFSSDPYWGSGYDHGHVCPSFDKRYSKAADAQTFYLTNMQPQRNKFNAGIWQKMENWINNTKTGLITDKTLPEDTLYVCKGGTIDAVKEITDDPILTTLPSGLIVPKYFFMALLRKNSQGYKAMAFWVEHINADRSGDALRNYAINIRELERRTGIDFFCNLPDNIEETVETLPLENVIKAWNL